jgi:hypothetical protein
MSFVPITLGDDMINNRVHPLHAIWPNLLQLARSNEMDSPKLTG